MHSFEKLVELFRQFPGIGPRQAKRFGYFLLTKDAEYLKALTKHIAELTKETVRCADCLRFFGRRGTATLCTVCADKDRDDSELMVVATDTDLDAIEKSNGFHGRYFVLGVTIPLLEKKTETKPRLKELCLRVTKGVKTGALKEIILGLSANPEGEHTGDELRRVLTPLLSPSIKISTLGRGLSTGSELEYADAETLKQALTHRE